MDHESVTLLKLFNKYRNGGREMATWRQLDPHSRLPLVSPHQYYNRLDVLQQQVQRTSVRH